LSSFIFRNQDLPQEAYFSFPILPYSPVFSHVLKERHPTPFNEDKVLLVKLTQEEKEEKEEKEE
jgi:hypothetical protein